MICLVSGKRLSSRAVTVREIDRFGRAKASDRPGAETYVTLGHYTLSHLGLARVGAKVIVETFLFDGPTLVTHFRGGE